MTGSGLIRRRFGGQRTFRRGGVEETRCKRPGEQWDDSLGQRFTKLCRSSAQASLEHGTHAGDLGVVHVYKAKGGLGHKAEHIHDGDACGPHFGRDTLILDSGDDSVSLP
jgi:hypothetical protein